MVQKGTPSPREDTYLSDTGVGSAELLPDCASRAELGGVGQVVSQEELGCVLEQVSYYSTYTNLLYSPSYSRMGYSASITSDEKISERFDFAAARPVAHLGGHDGSSLSVCSGLKGKRREGQEKGRRRGGM